MTACLIDRHGPSSWHNANANTCVHALPYQILPRPRLSATGDHHPAPARHHAGRSLIITSVTLTLTVTGCGCAWGCGCGYGYGFSFSDEPPPTPISLVLLAGCRHTSPSICKCHTSSCIINTAMTAMMYRPAHRVAYAAPYTAATAKPLVRLSLILLHQSIQWRRVCCVPVGVCSSHTASAANKHGRHWHTCPRGFACMSRRPSSAPASALPPHRAVEPPFACPVPRLPPCLCNRLHITAFNCI